MQMTIDDFSNEKDSSIIYIGIVANDKHKPNIVYIGPDFFEAKKVVKKQKNSRTWIET